MKILISNADHDTWTRYLKSWTDKIRNAAAKSGRVDIVEISGDKATRENFEKALKTEKPDIIIVNGHGQPDVLHGYEWNILVHADSNPDILKDKITHAIACASLDEVGVKVVETGGRAYIGYTEDIYFYCSDKEKHEDRLADDAACLFLDPAFEVAIALIEGCSVEAAFLRGRNQYSLMMRNVLQSNIPDKEQYLIQLFHHFRVFKFLGDGSASVSV